VPDMGSHSSAEYGIGMYPALKDEYMGKGINVFLALYRNGKFTSFQGRDSLFARVRYSITNTIQKEMM
jgi:hypothetical protein